MVDNNKKSINGDSDVNKDKGNFTIEEYDKNKKNGSKVTEVGRGEESDNNTEQTDETGNSDDDSYTEEMESELITDDETLSIEEKFKNKLKLLRDKLRDCESEKREIRENEQRSKADFLNAKRRLEDELKRKVIKTKYDFVADLLPLCDSFESAMNDKSWNNVDSSWKQGVEGIYAQLQQLLKSYGVESFSPTGEIFDPNLHEAVGVKETTDENHNNTVAEVVQCGYKAKIDSNTEAKVLRPARVITAIKSDNSAKE